MTTTTAPRAFPATRAGAVVVRLTRTDSGTYNVTCEYPSTGRQIDELCIARPTIGEALICYTARVAAFRRGLTVNAALDILNQHAA